MLAWKACFWQNHDADTAWLHGASEVSQSQHYCVHLCNITLLSENMIFCGNVFVMLLLKPSQSLVKFQFATVLG